MAATELTIQVQLVSVREAPHLARAQYEVMMEVLAWLHTHRGPTVQ